MELMQKKSTISLSDFFKQKLSRDFYILCFSWFFVAVSALLLILVWVFWAGPNTDTMLTYHRNHNAHNFVGMLTILSQQDQAPLPQLLDYMLYLLGFSGVVSLQLISSFLIFLGMAYVLSLDLGSDPEYRKNAENFRKLFYFFAVVAILLSPAFGAILTWVRYSSIAGLLWYLVWVIEEQLLYVNPQYKERYGFLLGILLSVGMLISYSWAVVIVASVLSLIWHQRKNQFVAFKKVVLGAIPGIFALFSWFIYAGSYHISLILLRAHSPEMKTIGAGYLLKLTGKALHLLLYPFVGMILFPSLINGLIIFLSIGVIVFLAWLYCNENHKLIAPFFLHCLMPVPFFLMTNVTSGYNMMGPGLIIISCAIKGILRLASSWIRVFFSITIIFILSIATIINLIGWNTMSPNFHANKSREALRVVSTHLVAENALNKRTLILTGDESTQFLSQSLSMIRHRFIFDIAYSSALNVQAMLDFGYPQDSLTPDINRVVCVFLQSAGDSAFASQLGYTKKWLNAHGFIESSFHREIGPYSHWLDFATGTTVSAQYLIKEWVRRIDSL